MKEMRTWQKIVYLSGTNSFLMSGDPDFTRLLHQQDHVLHPLLAEAWTIKSITPVMGGTAFLLLEKTAEADEKGQPLLASAGTANPVTTVSPVSSAAAPTAAKPPGSVTTR